MVIAANANITSADIGSQISGTITITLPTGASSSSICVVTWGLDDGGTGANPTITAPSGWTLIGSQTTGSLGGTRVSNYSFWSLGNNTNLSFTFTKGNSALDDVGWIVADFTGCNTTTPIDATGTVTTVNSATSITANGVTIATNNAWLCYGFCDYNSAAITATGFTVKENAAAHASAVILYNTTPKSTGATGTTVISDGGSATGQILSAIPFALRPAAGGATSYSSSLIVIF